jgi:predicted deacylase
LPTTRVPEGILVDVEGCAGPTVLPQFFFPGWSASAGEPLAVAADPETGLVRVDLPAGTRGVLLRRVRLPAEERGLRVTAFALLLWAACAAGALGWRRATPVRPGG